MISVVTKAGLEKNHLEIIGTPLAQKDSGLAGNLL